MYFTPFFSASDDEPLPEVINEDYSGILHDLAKKWLVIELKHRVSKTTSNAFWELAKTMFPSLSRAKIEERVYKRVPKFQSQRRRLFKDNLPKIKLEIGYMNKETREIVVVESDKTPVSRFSPHEYEKLYEVASVEVKSKSIFS